jgi:hypothetical protein
MQRSGPEWSQPPISQAKLTTIVIVAEQSKSVSNFKGESATSNPSETICPCFSRVPRRLVQGLVLSRLKNTAPGQRVLGSEPRKLTVTSAHL